MPFNRSDVTIHRREVSRNMSGGGEVFSYITAPTSLPPEQWIALNHDRTTAVITAKFSAGSKRRIPRADPVWDVYGQPMGRRGDPLATGVDWYTAVKTAIDWVMSSQRTDGRIAPPRLGIRGMCDLSTEDRSAVIGCLETESKAVTAERFGITIEVVDAIVSDDRKRRTAERDALWRADAEIVPQLSIDQLAERWGVCAYTAGVWLRANGLVRGSGRGKFLFGVRLAQYREHGGDKAALAKLWHVGEGAVNAWASRWGVDRPKRLSPDEKEAAKNLLADGVSIKRVSATLGVSNHIVSKIAGPEYRARRAAIAEQRMADVKSGLYTREELAERWGIGYLSVSNWVLRNLGEGRPDMFLPTKRFDANRKSAGGWGRDDIDDAVAIVDGIISEMERRSSRRREKVAINRIKFSIGRYIDAVHNTASKLPSVWGMTERAARKWLERHLFTPRRTVPTVTETETAQKFERAAMSLLETNEAHRPILSRQIVIDPRRTIWIDTKEMIGISWAIGGIAIVAGGRLLKAIKDEAGAPFEARVNGLFLSVGNGEVYFSVNGLSGSYYPRDSKWEIVDEK